MTRHLLPLLTILGIMTLPGCLHFDLDGPSGGDSTTVKREVAELVRQYRLCLKKYEDNPAKARENCGVYRDAIRDLGPDAQKSLLVELLDRLQDKDKEKARKDKEKEG